MDNKELMQLQLSTMLANEGLDKTKPKCDQKPKTEERNEELKKEFVEYRAGEQRLHAYWAERSSEYRQRYSLPLRADDGRINMYDYKRFASPQDSKNYYSDVQRRKHLQTVQHVKKLKEVEKAEYIRNTPVELRTEYSAGENFEVYSLALLEKVLREICLALRTSLQDDGANSADGYLIYLEDGTPLALFDYVGDNRGQRYQGKKLKLEQINLEQGGTTLNYGITFDENRKIKMTQIEQVPLLYLSISNTDLKRAIVDFEPDPNKLSHTEMDIFIEFYHEMSAQVRNMLRELHNSNSHPELRKNLKKFQTLILMNPKVEGRIKEFKQIVG